MTFEYREHVSESWIVARGETLEVAFSEGAKALFNLMVPIEQINPIQTTTINCEAESLDLLFFEWLNQLILIKDVDGAIFSKFEINISGSPEIGYTLEASAVGERFDDKTHDGQVDVKAATYSELKCEKTESGFEVGCVLDI